jgi:branched-chain amino acid transport system permease protein
MKDARTAATPADVVVHRPSRRGGSVGLLVAAIALAAVPPILPSYPLTLLNQVLIYAVFAMSLDLLLGYTGLASLGHAAYFGIAAYVVAIGTTLHQWSFWLCLSAGILAAVAVAAVFGLVAIRAVGVYFLMITLALGMVVWGLAFRWVSLTQGDNGIAGVTRPELAPGISISDSIPFYYASLVAFLLSFGLLSILVRSPFGLSLQGIRETERRMRALGYNVWLHKYLAFIISAGFAGFAGVLWAYYQRFVSPVEAHLVTSVEALLMVAVGGAGTLAGPVLGAGIIVFVKNMLSQYTERWLLVLGILYIVVIAVAPKGILGAIRGERR